MLDNIFRFFYYWTTGILTWEAVKFSLFVFPAVIIGMLIGVKADLSLKEDTIKRFIIILLIISGAVLFIKNMF